jgi:hypothetical protein
LALLYAASIPLSVRAFGQLRKRAAELRAAEAAASEAPKDADSGMPPS